MKKMITRVLSLALAVALVLTLAPAAFAADAPATSGTFGDNITWRFDADTGALTIEGTGRLEIDSDAEDFNPLSQTPWSRFLFNDLVKSVTIGEGITYVADDRGGDLFCYADAVTELNLPESLEEIGYAAFDGFGIQTLKLPKNLKRIGDEAFEGCSMTEFIWPDALESIGDHAFAYCSQLRELILPDTLKSMGQYAFSGCSQLREFILPDSIQDLGSYAFSNCNSLEFVYMSGRINYSQSTFAHCSNLQTAVIGDGVTCIPESTFSNCPKLKTVYLPHSVKKIERNAFFFCQSMSIYYDGTEEDIAAIDMVIGDPHDGLYAAPWYLLGLPFSDTPRDWSYKFIQALWLDGIITGYDDNTFRPNNSITRAEFVTLLAGIAKNCGVEVGDSKTASGKFSDVASGSWYVPAIEWAASTGIVAGHTDGTFCPNNSITRQEMAAIIARFADAYGVPLDAVKDPVAFTDAGSISSYARDAVAAMQTAGIINGYRESDGSYTFRPLNSATRAEAAVMLCGLYMVIPVE